MIQTIILGALGRPLGTKVRPRCAPAFFMTLFEAIFWSILDALGFIFRSKIDVNIYAKNDAAKVMNMVQQVSNN